MASKPLSHLWRALDMKLSEVLGADFVAGVLGGGAGVTLALVAPESLLSAAGVASEIVGVIIGAVVGGVSILAAFFDQSFLRKLRAIGRDPVRYMAPFLFTAVIGVLAMLSLLVLSSATATAPAALLAVAGGLAGLFSVWTLVSLLPLLATLVQFIRLKVDALDVPDDAASGDPAVRKLHTGPASSTHGR